MIEKIKEHAGRLLKEGSVELVLAYKRATDGLSACPAFVRHPEDVESLIWDSLCVYNLSNFLPGLRGKKVAIVAKGCDIRAIVGLVQEHQVDRKEVLVIAVECAGVLDSTVFGEPPKDCKVQAKCRSCKVHSPKFFDILVKDERLGEKVVDEAEPYSEVDELERLSPEERFDFWKSEFSKCIKCYACRQACPLCYCPTCVADQTSPRWLSREARFLGNFSWNVTRAFHLAGRCIDCGECERVCPVGIPLRKLNKKLEKYILETYGYTAGVDTEAKPPLQDFRPEDKGDFIL
jgi:ferredoxin